MEGYTPFDEQEMCPCSCHEDGEPYCGNCFDDHVVLGLNDNREID